VVYYRPKASQADILEKNRIYDHAADLIWRLAVYEPVHDGWEFTNIGGSHVLDFIGHQAQLGPDTEVVEFCSGLGDACRYLAVKFGCRVTGIDMNIQQIQHARAKLARMHPERARHIHFEHSDVLAWQPPKRYDVVFALDSLILINGTLHVLKKAHETLKPQGLLVLAETLAGPHITDEICQRVWDMDGFISLLKPSEYMGMLAEAGFTSVVLEDMTDGAEACFETISVAVRQQKKSLMATAGLEAYKDWQRSADRYKQWFHQRVLLYTRISAVRQGP
jgi:SAM-dependent methyltransferase